MLISTRHQKKRPVHAARVVTCHSSSIAPPPQPHGYAVISMSVCRVSVTMAHCASFFFSLSLCSSVIHLSLLKPLGYYVTTRGRHHAILKIHKVPCRLFDDSTRRIRNKQHVGTHEKGICLLLVIMHDQEIMSGSHFQSLRNQERDANYWR